MGTSLHAIAATDTLRGIRCLVRSNVHLTGTGAHTTLGALTLVYIIAIDTDTVKQSVKGAQRTDVSAEGSEYHHGKDDYRQQDYHFPGK